ncbi:methyltransferase domain-containing protein [Ruegeria sp.]|uniref:methyltransferase domain-containing protein n=1 Tax=Ruegeria sp. TaxID=1879320 RepID=UPI003B5BD1AF
MLKFDTNTARLLENVYLGSDVSRRRRASFDALLPSTGETILDLGCGNGLLTAELARAVGSTGQVTGLDPSPDMLSLAKTRCAEFGHVDLIEGPAEEMPFADNQFDKAASVQVFEYFPDTRPALRELHRVLRPGGRLVIGDIHWDSLCWHSDQPARMSSMIDIWDGHLADRCIPATLPPSLRECGFEPERVVPVVICDTTLRPDGLAMMTIRLAESYAVQTEQVPEDAAAAWVQEQFDLAKQGRFFFSITHFVWIAHKT